MSPLPSATSAAASTRSHPAAIVASTLRRGRRRHLAPSPPTPLGGFAASRLERRRPWEPFLEEGNGGSFPSDSSTSLTNLGPNLFNQPCHGSDDLDGFDLNSQATDLNDGATFTELLRSSSTNVLQDEVGRDAGRGGRGGHGGGRGSRGGGRACARATVPGLEDDGVGRGAVAVHGGGGARGARGGCPTIPPSSFQYCAPRPIGGRGAHGDDYDSSNWNEDNYGAEGDDVKGKMHRDVLNEGS